jgi:hypothetical protein
MSFIGVYNMTVRAVVGVGISPILKNSQKDVQNNNTKEFIVHDTRVIPQHNDIHMWSLKVTVPIKISAVLIFTPRFGQRDYLSS